VYSAINEKLIEVQGEKRKIIKYRVQLADYEQEVDMIDQTISQLQRELAFEQKDVTKLESITLTNFFSTLSGSKKGKLTKERQEVMVLQHKLVEAEKSRIDIYNEMVEIQNKLQKINNIDDRYQQLLLEKEKMIKKSTSPFSAKIFELGEEEGALRGILTELKEAIVVGNLVKRALMEAKESLEQAEGWGTIDMMGGVGVISNIIKHKNIEQAEEKLHNAQTCMRKFQKELIDVRKETGLEIDISGMLKFADFFIGGFIADYMVQRSVIKAMVQIEVQQQRVNDILLKLNNEYIETKNKAESVQKEKEDLIKKI
jgi:hypothetical protein